jgi:cyclophilin family peptidyl-prolyl cis-trans isomerase
MQKFISVVCGCAMVVAGQAQTHSSETIRLQTAYGEITIKLFEETPLHKANFLKLARGGFFDSLLFHRVINYFMIQGGDPLSKHARSGDSLGHGDLGYTVPAEINPGLIHQKGRLCAARESDDINPQFASSASQFYLVVGKPRTMDDLKKYEDRINKNRYQACARAFVSSGQGRDLQNRMETLKKAGKADSAAILTMTMEAAVKKSYDATPPYRFNQHQVSVYTTVGGTPHLDGTYTVFGEVIQGLDVIDKIAALKTDQRDRPVVDVRMKVSVSD